MSVSYDQESDTLTIKLAPEICDDRYEFEAGDFTAVIDQADSLAKITITRASKFLRRALAAGVEVEGAPTVAPPQEGMIWHDADSSMISAYAYDEAEGVLEVAFHRTGVYRYYDVPLHVYEGLRDAESKGRYMRAWIIDMYPYEKKRGR